MRDLYFARRGIAYRTNDIRPGRATLVFVHGLSGSSSAWYPYEEFFAARFNMVTFDLRGHGLSERWKNREQYELGEFARDMSELLLYLHIKRATFIAHSFGGAVVREFLQAPTVSVEKVIFLAPTYGIERRWLSAFLRPLCAGLAWLLTSFMLPSTKGRLDYAPFRGGGDFDLTRIFADIKTTGLKSYLWSLLALYRSPSAHWYICKHFSTTILHGAKDRFVPLRLARELALRTAPTKLIVLPTANHMLVNNNIKEVSNIVMQGMRQ